MLKSLHLSYKSSLESRTRLEKGKERQYDVSFQFRFQRPGKESKETIIESRVSLRY